MILRIFLLIFVGIPAAVLIRPACNNDPELNETSGFDNGIIRIVFIPGDDGYREMYYARDSRAWVLMLESGSDERPEPSLRADGENVDIGYSELSVPERSAERTHIQLRAKTDKHSITKDIYLFPGNPAVYVRIGYEINGEVDLHYLLSTYSFAPDGKAYTEYKPLDFIFTPQLRPETDDVIGDHIFRAPALMMQKKNRFAALLPDHELIGDVRRIIKTAADMQIETGVEPFVSYGLMNWERRREHVYYTYTDTLPAHTADTVLTFGYTLYLDASAPEKLGYRNIIRYQWENIGINNLLTSASPQHEPFDRYIHKAWHEFLPAVALDTVYNDRPVTLIRQGRLAWSNNLHPGADNDTWFNVWFQSLRTAYGLYIYATETGDSTRMRQARNVLSLVLEAPQMEGIAPSVFYLDEQGGHWVPDHAWGGIENGEYYSMFHNSWTGYWLLRWTDLISDMNEEILRFTKSFGDFLVRKQQSSGVIPSWYNPETLEPSDILRDENAETAGAALFLAELHARTQDRKYLAAAEKAMSYIFTHIVPEHKWFDYETFFSCSRKEVGFFDTYTQSHPQNTLSLHQAVEACNRLFHLTGKNRYREYGESLLDYLLLYQQIWSPAFLSCDLFGGFGVQNADGEWSDSRQGYFAVTLADYYRLTGRREYLERAVAALRAMFSLFESPDSPRTYENYGHASFDMPGGVTGINWGTGSSVVSIHLIREQFGDAYIHVQDEWGVGIDGCTVTDVRVEGHDIAIEITDLLSHPREIRMKFDFLTLPDYNLRINGKYYGPFHLEDLRKGIIYVF
jgi:hypothetical protein